MGWKVGRTAFFGYFLLYGQKVTPPRQWPPEGSYLLRKTSHFDELSVTLLHSLPMTIVTKTGDKGETGLYGGQRVPKDDLRIETIGAIDELNALLSLPVDSIDLSLAIIEQISITQNTLFTLGADIATPHENNNAVAPRMTTGHIDAVEAWISELEQTPLPPYFILPGGSAAASHLHMARAVCRRTERLAVSLGKRTEIGQEVLIYLNRLSDYLFLAALEANRNSDVQNIRVRYS